MAINDFEHQHQVAFFQLVEIKLLKKYPFLDKLLFSVPNGHKRSKSEAGKIKAEGGKSGIADVLCLFPARGYNYLCIEMKYGKNKQSDSQKEFEERVTHNGKGYYYMAYSSQEAFKVLSWYLGN